MWTIMDIKVYLDILEFYLEVRMQIFQISQKLVYSTTTYNITLYPFIKSKKENKET